MDNPLWYKDAVFYEVYVRAFSDSNDDGHGDLRGLLQRLDYLQALGVTCLWLLPLYPSPLKDDGYDIADYYGVLREYGSREDLADLVRAVHARGMRIVLDLVLNHTSDQHPWFQSARADRSSPYRDYYVWSDSDELYKEARIIFLDTEKSNWTWDEAAGQYFWHRFYSSQPDLNYDNPAVQQEMLNVMKFWLELGIDGFRADAVPYLFERPGTNCENLPETHAYLKRIRQYIDEHYPGCILLAEANQWPADVLPYFGEGDGDEFQMGFHFPLMPRIYLSLFHGSRAPIEWILGQTPPIPAKAQWCTFLRNHDELTLEMVTEQERQELWEHYAPEPRMRLNLGIRRRLAPLLDYDRRKIELANVLLFSLPGSPIIYYGDEIGMGDDIWLPDRNGVRTPMQWQSGPGLGFSSAPQEKWYAPPAGVGLDHKPVDVASQQNDPASLLSFMRRLVATRQARPAFSQGSFAWAAGLPEAVAGCWRTYNDQRLLALHNLSHLQQPVALDLPGETWRVILSSPGQPTAPEGFKAHLDITLEPYQYLWLEAQ